MTKIEKMHLYGITNEDMNADVEKLSSDTLRYRFVIEFDGDAASFGCCQTGEYGYFDGENFRIRPDNVTDKDENNLIKESLKAKKNLFIERWTDIAKFKNDVEY